MNRPFNPRLNQNNYRKLHGRVKLSRHWKSSALIKLKTEDIIAAFGSAEELNRMIESIESTCLSEMDRQYNNYLRRSYRDRD